MLDWLTLGFILTAGSGVGSPPPVELQVKSLTSLCGRDGAMVGVQVDRLVNPTAAMFRDPSAPTKHCRVDIATRVLQLPKGQYHIATTQHGTSPLFRSPDPHLSGKWTRETGTAPSAPTIQGIQAGSVPSVPVTKTLSWEKNPEPDVTKYVVTMDGKPLGETPNLSMPVTFPAFRTYQLSLVAVNTKGESSVPSTLTYTLTATTTTPVSPNNSLLPPLTQLVDASGGIWTLGTTGRVLKDGENAANGIASKLLWYNATMYAFAENVWYQWTGTAWTTIGPTQPGTTTPPVPTEPTLEELKAEVTRLNALLITERHAATAAAEKAALDAAAALKVSQDAYARERQRIAQIKLQVDYALRVAPANTRKEVITALRNISSLVLAP